MILASLVALQVGKGSEPPWSVVGPRYAALDRALGKGNFAVAGRLLDSGLKVDRIVSHGDTRLMIACGEGKLEIAQFLVRRGAAVEHCAWRSRMTAFGYAVNADRPRVVEWLLKIGANSEGARGGTPPLVAAGYGHAALVRRLLRAGAWVDATDGRGMTALMAAAWTGSTETVRVLLAAGANRKLADWDGATVLSLARQKGFREIERLLAR